MKVSFFALLLCLPASSYAQNKITGYVKDITTQEPIAYASVFLANTSVGISTDQNGRIFIEEFPDGKYVLSVTHVGYQNYQVALDFDQIDEFSDHILLVPVSVTLPQIEINEDTTGRKENLEIFKRLVIGASGNANYCSLLNPDKVHLYHDAVTKSLFGHSKEPLIIENKALGYRIFYLIDTFEYSPSNGLLTTFGIPRFEFLKSNSQEERSRWEKNREGVYLGSVLHFMRSLFQDQLTQNGFALIKLNGSKNQDVTDSLHVRRIPLPENQEKTSFTYDGKLLVKFNRNKIKYRLGTKLKGNKKIESSMTLLGHEITIYSNGQYENIKSVLYEGHWAQAETMANWLPYDYQLEIKSK